MTAARRQLLVAIAVLAFAVPARAETIQITSGSLQWMGRFGGSPVTLVGEGFVFQGFAGNGLFAPDLQCEVCFAGATIDLLGRWVGLDLGGTATVNGTTYTGVGGLTATTSLDARWDGSLEIPLDFTGGVLTAPFQFTATFFNPGAQVDLFGAGIASLTLVPNLAIPGGFELGAATYQFSSDAPVPEPMSMMLVGTGLGLAALRRRRT